MPGIVLSYSKIPQNIDPKDISNDISSLMYNFKESSSLNIVCNNRASLSIVYRTKDLYGIIESEEGFLAWYGKPLYNGRLFSTFLFSDIREFLERHDIATFINCISGSFQLVIYLRASDECYVISDKVSSCPFYYTDNNSFIVFSPEPLSLKALKRDKWHPSIRAGALFEFMASGHLWGDATFYKEVMRLGPGQYAHIKQNNITISSYWSMTFNHEPISEKTLIKDLFKAIEEDINDLPEGRKILTLSGGFDSRALLGFLKKGSKQCDTVSYSFGQDISTGTDAEVGKYFADKVGFPNAFHRALNDPDALISNIKRAIISTGGENHLVAAQDAFLGAKFYEDLTTQYDYMLRGDEVWGWGDYAVTYDMAFWECRLCNLNELIQPIKILKREVFDNGVAYLNNQRKVFTKEPGLSCVKPNNLKDYLYWRHREARLLQSMAYFRRCYIPHFAPFLFDRTLSVIRRVPGKLRIKKSLFMKMGKKSFPELFLDEKAITPYSSDVNNFELLYQNKKFKAFIKGALLDSESDIFNNAFDKKALETWIDKVFTYRSSDVKNLQKSYDFKKLVNRFLAPTARIKGCIKAFLVHNDKNKFPILDVNYLFRLVVLSLALQEYERN